MSYRSNTAVITAIASGQIDLAIGDTVQAYSEYLADISGLTLTAGAGKVVVVNGTNDGLALTSNALGTAAFVNTGTATGNVPVLDGNGKLSTSVLPALAITEVFVVADNTERDGLTVEEGDVAIVTGDNKTYIYDGSVWQEILTPAAVVSVNGQTGVVDLDLADITGVTLDSPADGEFLKYNGSAWVNSTIDYTDIDNLPTIPVNFVDLGDVPGSFTGAGGYFVKVTSGATALEFVSTATALADYYTKDEVDGLLSDVDTSVAATVVKTDAGNVTATASNYAIIVMKASGEATTVTLPAVGDVVVGKMIIVKDGKGDAGTNNITIDGDGAETIDGQASIAITNNYESVTLICNGIGWNII